MNTFTQLILIEEEQEYVLAFSEDKLDWIARFDKSWSEAYNRAKNMKNLYNQRGQIEE
jgi:hypothetical protein